MRENKITVVIDRSIKDVFEFTTNPKSTHLWIPSIQEEVSDEFPLKVGTQYRNRAENSDWDVYQVIEYDQFNIFTLSDLDGNYHVRYTYREMNDIQTKMEYFEWMEDGILKNPFTQSILNNLKFAMDEAL